jgi:uncharacterized protein YciI
LPTFVVLLDYAPNMLERRLPYRAAHLERLNKLTLSGILRFAGAWADPLDGAIWIVDADVPDDVERLVQDDPYFSAGLTPTWTVRQVSPAPLSSAQNG